MQRAKLWEFSADELEQLSKDALEVAALKRQQEEFEDALPADVHELIGQFLAEDDPTALGRLAQTSRYARDVHRRTLTRLEKEANAKKKQFVDAFYLIRPLIFNELWEENIPLILQFFEQNNSEHLPKLIEAGITSQDTSRIDELLDLRAPRNCRLVVSLPNGETFDRGSVTGFTLRRVFDLFIPLPLDMYKYIELSC